MLMKAGLWRTDATARTEGYTLAAGLLFGKEDLIQQLVRAYKTPRPWADPSRPFYSVPEESGSVQVLHANGPWRRTGIGHLERE